MLVVKWERGWVIENYLCLKPIIMIKYILIFFSFPMLCFTSKSQNVEIPDPAFKTYLLSNPEINTDEDKLNISQHEANLFNGKISIPSLKIKSLQGIEAFVNLTSLNCSNNKLTDLDVSHNVSLSFLSCHNNLLTHLDVSKNRVLESLSCFGNKLHHVDVTHNYKLKYLQTTNHFEHK